MGRNDTHGSRSGAVADAWPLLLPNHRGAGKAESRATPFRSSARWPAPNGGIDVIAPHGTQAPLEGMESPLNRLKG